MRKDTASSVETAEYNLTGIRTSDRRRLPVLRVWGITRNSPRNNLTGIRIWGGNRQSPGEQKRIRSTARNRLGTSRIVPPEGSQPMDRDRYFVVLHEGEWKSSTMVSTAIPAPHSGQWKFLLKRRKNEVPPVIPTMRGQQRTLPPSYKAKVISGEENKRILWTETGYSSLQRQLSLRCS